MLFLWENGVWSDNDGWQSITRWEIWKSRNFFRTIIANFLHALRKLSCDKNLWHSFDLAMTDCRVYLVFTCFCEELAGEKASKVHVMLSSGKFIPAWDVFGKTTLTSSTCEILFCIYFVDLQRFTLSVSVQKLITVCPVKPKKAFNSFTISSFT